VSELRRSLRAEGKDVYYAVFSELWNDGAPEDDAQKSSYAQIARKHGISENDVGNFLRLVRQRLRGILKEIVTDYLGPGESAEDEVKFILSR